MKNWLKESEKKAIWKSTNKKNKAKYRRSNQYDDQDVGQKTNEKRWKNQTYVCGQAINYYYWFNLMMGIDLNLELLNLAILIMMISYTQSNWNDRKINRNNANTITSQPKNWCKSLSNG